MPFERSITQPVQERSLNTSQVTLAHSQQAVDQMRQQAQQAQQQATQANSAPQIAKETGKGILGTLSDMFIKPIGRALTNVDVAKTAVTQGPQAAQQLAQTGVNDPMLGNVKPIGMTGQGFGADLADTAATGVQAAATYLPVGKAVGVLAPKIASAGAKLAESSGLTQFLSDRLAGKATNLLASTADTMTKGERLSAIQEGRQVPTLGGGGKFLPSDTETNAGKLLAGKLESNPVKNVPIVQKEIATRGQEAENYLTQNAKPISNAEDFNAFKAKRDEMAKYSTPAEMKAYDDQVTIFSKQLLGRGANNTANYYKALKEYETNVTSRLPKGKEALLTETGSAKLQAAKDVRTVVRDMIGEKNPEFKPKMYDLASLYDSLDNVVTKAEQVGTFAKRHPTASKALKYGVEAVGAGAIYEGARKLGVPLPGI